MDSDRFQHAVRNGLGRAVLAVKDGPWRPHADAIAAACLHNTAYDPQCEGLRADYVHEIVRRTDAPEHFVQITNKGLLEAREYWDVSHLFELSRLFAIDGHPTAKSAIFEKFQRDDAQEHFLGAEQIIKLDGVEGLLFVLDFIGRQIDANPAIGPIDDGVITFTQDEVTVDAPTLVLEAAKGNANIRRFLDQVARQKQEQGVYRHDRPDWKHFSYSQLRERILASRGDVPLGWLFGWGKRASTEALEQAAADLLREQDEDCLLAYLRIFNLRAFPGPCERLIEIAGSDHPKLALAARRALRHLQTPAIRAFALEQIQRGQAGEIAELLARNYVPGDQRLIEDLLDKTQDEDEIHGLGHAAVAIFNHNKTPDSMASMLRIYERVRCGICRHGAVENLADQRLVPDWMLAECRHDSYEYTRDLATGYEAEWKA